MYTPIVIADMMARQVLVGVRPGQSVHDHCAGTGGLLRAAAQAARAQGVDPATLRWYAPDIDPVAVAALAVNVHLWRLGGVVIGCADTLAEPDWDRRALEEQNQALAEHKLRVAAAHLLALTGRDLPSVSDAEGRYTPDAPSP